MLDGYTLMDNGTRELILFNYGKGSDGRNRMAIAPFTIIKSEGKTYIMPNSARVGGLQTAVIRSFLNAESCDSRDPAYLQTDAGGWFDGSVKIMEENELGDWKGQGDNWRGMHRFCMNI